MSSRTLRFVLPFVVLVLGVVGARVLIASRPQPARHAPSEIAPTVEFVTVRPTAHRLDVRAQGTVQPRTSSTLVAEVGGRVVAVADDFVDGGYFEEGDVLVVLDDRDHRAAVADAEAAVADARVALEREREEARVAREEWERLHPDETPTALVLRQPQLARAEASVAAARARLERARRDLDRTRLRAPYRGRVRTKRVDRGDFLAPGAPAADLYAVDFAEVRLPLDDRDLAFLDLPLGLRDESPGPPGPRVVLEGRFAGRLHHWEGFVHRMEGEIDPRTRMVHVVARVADPYGRAAHDGGAPLAVGLFVGARIEGVTADDVYLVPRRALQRAGQVGVVDDEDRLRLRAISLVREEGDTLVVASGLRPGDRVVVNRIDTPVDGMHLHPVPATPTGADPATNPPSEEPSR